MYSPSIMKRIHTGLAARECNKKATTSDCTPFERFFLGGGGPLEDGRDSAGAKAREMTNVKRNVK